MQVDRKSISIAIVILVLLGVLGTSVRLLYLETRPSPEPGSAASSGRDVGGAEDTEASRTNILYVLDLTRTPARTQRALFFLLLVPAGLLITALAKNLVGMPVIGTFSPTLLALSQARSDWRIGLVIFAVTFGLGSLCRMMLMGLGLSTVPRRGVIGTFVVLALAAAISLSNSFGLAPTARHVLLPVAVMTVMIEKFFTAIEKEGNKTALILLANSVAVAVCCFLVFAYTPTGRILLRFPELELLIVAVLILLGLYSGKPLLNALSSSRDGKPGIDGASAGNGI